MSNTNKHCKQGTFNLLWTKTEYDSCVEWQEIVRKYWLPVLNIRFKPLPKPRSNKWGGE